MGCSSSKAAAPSQAANGTLLHETGQAGTEKQKPTEEKSLQTIDITIKKTPNNNQIGLEGETAGECWLVNGIADGLVRLWNEQNEGLSVEVGDKILSCNGVRGDGEKILDAMEKGTDLQMTVAKMNASLEKSAPVEKNEVASLETGIQTIPESGDQQVDAFRSRLADSLDLAVQSGDLAAAISASAPTQVLDEAANGATSTMEEHMIPDNKPGGWMCCSAK